MRGRSDSSSAAQGGRPGGGGGAGGPAEALRSSAERDRDVPADSLRTSAGAFEPSGRSREAERWSSEDAQPAGSSSARQGRQPSQDAAGERAHRPEQHGAASGDVADDGGHPGPCMPQGARQRAEQRPQGSPWAAVGEGAEATGPSQQAYNGAARGAQPGSASTDRPGARSEASRRALGDAAPSDSASSRAARDRGGGGGGGGGSSGGGGGGSGGGIGGGGGGGAERGEARSARQPPGGKAAPVQPAKEVAFELGVMWEGSQDVSIAITLLPRRLGLATLLVKVMSALLKLKARAAPASQRPAPAAESALLRLHGSRRDACQRLACVLEPARHLLLLGGCSVVGTGRTVCISVSDAVGGCAPPGGRRQGQAEGQAARHAAALRRAALHRRHPGSLRCPLSSLVRGRVILFESAKLLTRPRAGGICGDAEVPL
jgi:hypothetical protein